MTINAEKYSPLLPTGNHSKAGLEVVAATRNTEDAVGSSESTFIAFGPNDLQCLNQIHPWSAWSQHDVCTKICLGVSMLSFVLCLWGVMDYSSFWAQAEANKCRCTFHYSPSLAAYLFLFWVIFQAVGASVPFGIWLQSPILKRYTNEGRRISGTVIYRVPQEQGQRGRESKSYELVIAYKPDPIRPSVIYAKKMDVKREEFEMSTLDIIVLPEIPTSAVLKRIHDVRAGYRSAIILIVVLVISPFLWVYLMKHTSYLGQYNHSTFWEGHGPWIIFCLSWAFSVCFGYFIVVDANIEMLHRGSQCIADGVQNEEVVRPISTREHYMMDEEESEAGMEII